MSHSSFLSAQSYLKAQVRSTNCPVSHKQADLWFFGEGAGIDFRDDVAVPSLENHALTMPRLQSQSMLCDSLGNLICVSNGIKVWGRTQQIMPNGSDLDGYIGVTQSSIVIPKPGDDSKFYVFTIDLVSANGRPGKGLRYSAIDINLNNGLGDVDSIEKNILLLPEVSQKLTATYASNGTDIWVVAHKWNSNEFDSYLVTAGGVNTSPVTTSLGTQQSGPLGDPDLNSVGYMKISPDGSKLALAIQGLDLFEIYNFDNSTGQVSSVITSPATFDGAYGVAFSPDTKYFYSSTAKAQSNPSGIPDTSYLYQWDISQGANIFNSPVVVAKDSTNSYFADLQLATDGRIYVARSPNSNLVLGVIYNPKRGGTECNFNLLNGNPTPFILGGKASGYGLPNFIQNYFDTPHFDVENICFSDTTILKLTNDANVTTASWDFGDGSGNSTGNTVFHSFPAAGTYQVTVTETYNGNTYGPYKEDIIVNELPVASLPDTLYMYPGSPILLQAGEGFTSYEWSTGENTSVITAYLPGMYYVTVQNERCCFNTDSVRVMYFDVLVPNAFRPGGVNSVFKAVPTSNKAINNFSMFIYNRWGQQIFQSNDIADGWDGTVKGNPAPGDVYVWLINYLVDRENGTEKITYKGNVVLLR